eukprot:TRINITY_DN11644_c0_g1_i6.p1 TRINITY_DN11644_c0_g1~~TRINITY_DN11644_c0_g1_i6.p1  ORF type:complete len:112 (+),score=28.73 TRINITY_DN11644_c0_g1_i6:45-338(+)
MLRSLVGSEMCIRDRQSPGLVGAGSVLDGVLLLVLHHRLLPVWSLVPSHLIPLGVKVLFPFVIGSVHFDDVHPIDTAQVLLNPVSYTHLTLPTKRIV